MASKLTYLFGPRRDDWTFDDGYLPFVTPYQIRTKISLLAKHEYTLNPDSTIIWDMFAGIGTDSIEFSSFSKKVICTELNSSTFENLGYNIAEFGTRNIEKHNIDCCSKNWDANVIFFDPPWGDTYVSGRDFDFHDVTLADGTNVVDLAKRIHRTYGDMIIKSPYESSTFEVEFDSHISKIYAFPKSKLKFLFLHRESRRP